LWVTVVKNFMTFSSPQSGALETSTTTSAPAIAWSSPSPVKASIPKAGDAATALCPASCSAVMTLSPISPLPPTTTILMLRPFVRVTADAAKTGQRHAS
jgi:hypothetical protein